MARMSNLIDEYENAKLNTGQMFFIMLSFIPLALFFPFWIVAKFIYEPWVKEISNMREEIPPIPFKARWPINAATDSDKIVNEKSLVFENTPHGNVLMKYNYEDELFEYWADKAIDYKDLDVVARKYVTLFQCKKLYIDRFALQKEKFKEARDKYLAKKMNLDDKNSSEKETKETSLFVKTKMEKAKEENKKYMVEDKVNINKLLAVEKANKFKRIGKFTECELWNENPNKTQVKEEVSNLSFSAFKDKFWSNKND